MSDADFPSSSRLIVAHPQEGQSSPQVEAGEEEVPPGQCQVITFTGVSVEQRSRITARLSVMLPSGSFTIAPELTKSTTLLLAESIWSVKVRVAILCKVCRVATVSIIDDWLADIPPTGIASQTSLPPLPPFPAHSFRPLQNLTIASSGLPAIRAEIADVCHSLGGSYARDVTGAVTLVIASHNTDKVKTALAVDIPVVSLRWLVGSVRAAVALDPDDFPVPAERSLTLQLLDCEALKAERRSVKRCRTPPALGEPLRPSLPLRRTIVRVWEPERTLPTQFHVDTAVAMVASLGGDLVRSDEEEKYVRCGYGATPGTRYDRATTTATATSVANTPSASSGSSRSAPRLPRGPADGGRRPSDANDGIRYVVVARHGCDVRAAREWASRRGAHLFASLSWLSALEADAHVSPSDFPALLTPQVHQLPLTIPPSRRVLTTSGFSSSERVIVELAARTCGFELSATYVRGETAVVVCAHTGSEKYRRARQQRANGCSVVNRQWILDCVANGALPDPQDPQYAVPSVAARQDPSQTLRSETGTMSADEEDDREVRPLAGCRVYVSRHCRDAAELTELVVSLGGILSESTIPETTHTVSEQRIKAALSASVHTVAPAWLYACRDQQRRVLETEFPAGADPRQRLGLSSSVRATPIQRRVMSRGSTEAKVKVVGVTVKRERSHPTAAGLDGRNVRPRPSLPHPAPVATTGVGEDQLVAQLPSDVDEFGAGGYELDDNRAGEAASMSEGGGGPSFGLQLSQYGLSSLHDTVVAAGAPGCTDETSMTSQYGHDEAVGEEGRATVGSLERGLTSSMLDDAAGSEVDASPVGTVAYGALRREEQLRTSRSRLLQRPIVVLSQVGRSGEMTEEGIREGLAALNIEVRSNEYGAVTHLVTGALMSSVKSFSAMAVGALFLRESWATKTIRRGRPVPPEEHEWTIEHARQQRGSTAHATERMSTNTTVGATAEVIASAWRKNRDEVNRRGGRPLLTEWRVIVCTDSTRRPPLVNVIRAGGGVVLAPGDKTATLIIAKSVEDVDPASLQLTDRTGAPVAIVKPMYLAEYLKRPDNRPSPQEYLTKRSSR